ncbi:MAG: hypothetical protein IKE41_03510 [Clostridia bacterium]|nr:hypothetical protein [Clostridia bacterium]MBR2735315.1 hypothetical protein [Clostridia bacterium]
MDRKQQIEKIAQILSDEELDKLAAGEMSPETRSKIEEIAKWTLKGVTAAGAVTAAAIGIAALVGGATGRGPFGSLKRKGTESSVVSNDSKKADKVSSKSYTILEDEFGSIRIIPQ